MNTLKKINSFNENRQKKSIIDRIDNKDLFKELYGKNPLHKTHDFFAFIYKDGFKQLDDGNYKKIMDIENMHKITKDNFNDLKGMNMRANFTQQKVGVIWWPKEMSDLIDGQSSDNMDLYLIDLIEKHMSTDHTYGRKVYNDVYNKNKKRSEKIVDLDNKIRDHDDYVREYEENRKKKRKKFNL